MSLLKRVAQDGAMVFDDETILERHLPEKVNLFAFLPFLWDMHVIFFDDIKFATL